MHLIATRLGCHWFMEASTHSLHTQLDFFIFYHEKYKDLNYCYNVIIIFLKKKPAMWGGWRSGNEWPVITMKLEIPEACRIVTQDNTN